MFNFDKLTDFSTEELARAVETVSTYTWSPDTRSIFTPENLDYVVKLIVPTDTPIRNRLPRTKGVGEAASWLKLTSRLDTTATNTSIFFNDGGEPNETTQSFASATQAYKILGRKLQIGVKAIEASRGRGGLNTVLEERTAHKVLEVMIGEEQAIIAGDSATNPAAFDGFYKQVTTSGTATLLSASGLQAFFETLHAAGGSPDFIVMNARQARALADDLEKSGSIARIIMETPGGVTAGARVRSVINELDGTEVETLVSRYVGGTAMIIQTRTAAGENCIEMEDLVPLSAVDKDLAGLAVTRYIYEISALKVIHEAWQMKLAGLAT